MGKWDSSAAELQPVEELVGTALDDVIGESSAWLGARQANDGHWLFELEADATISGEYILLNHYLGDIDDEIEAKIAAYLRRTQGSHGGWPLYHDGDFNISATVKAYYALKLAGDDPASPHMIRAREAVLAHGGAREGAGPVIVPVPLPWLALPGMRIEIEAVAMLGAGGERLPRRTASPPGNGALPAPFVHGLRCEEHVWTGAQTGAADVAFERMSAVLAALDASPPGLVRVDAWYAAGAPAAGLARHMDMLAATSVVLPTSRLPDDQGLRLGGWAMGGTAGAPAPREVSGCPDDWRWPGRKGRVMALGCGDMVFVSGQMPLDAAGAAVERGDLDAQTRLCLTRTGAALADFGLGLDDMVKQTTFFRGDADPADIVANQTLRSASFREPAGASTGVPLADCGIDGALASL